MSGHGGAGEPLSFAGKTVKGDLGTLATLLPYLWPRDRGDLRLRVVAAIACLAIAKAAAVSVPYFYKQAVDMLTNDVDAVLTALVAIMLFYGLARMADRTFLELREFFFARVAQRAMRVIALSTFRHLHRLSLRFHLDRQTGGLSRVIERGVKGIEFVLSFMLLNIVPTIIEIILVAVVLWALFDVWYTLVTLAAIGAYVAHTMLVTEWRLKFRREMNRSDQAANTKAIDSLLNFETVKYFSNEGHEASRFDDALRRYETASVKNKTSLSLLNIGQAAIIAIGLTVIMIMAAIDVRAGVMTVGDFVMVNAYLIQLYLPLNFLGFVYREIKQSLTDMEAMFRLVDEPLEVVDAASAPALEVTGGRIVFRDVSFHYRPDRPILKDISFEVPAGRTVAIVGPSGAGKSTLSRLLFRFYDIAGGAIEIDGQDIRQVSQDSLRQAIGIVPQDTVLFNDTIYYNIAYGQPSASPAEVEQAARLARIHDFVMAQPDGYQTMVGERGLKLSGGEKQRV
ncbi:MAG: ABC transporter ATP-binding protein/permease, partial [Pseudomonadota bacterium]|nr:ABC transporter ATP-binding protein/permease [Pseudomonadota bacterium]